MINAPVAAVVVVVVVASQLRARAYAAARRWKLNQ